MCKEDSLLPKLVELHLKICQETEESGECLSTDLTASQVASLLEEVKKLRKAKKVDRDKNLKRIKKIVENE